MNILFDNGELLRLITNLHTLTGIRASIYDASGKDICLDDVHMPFCQKINADKEGHALCVDCDKREIERCAGRNGAYLYRCHAGICEAIVPIRAEGKPLAYLLFGQYLDTSPIEKQWERTRRSLDWYSGDMEELRRAYEEFGQYTSQEIAAYTEVLEALAAYIQMAGMIRTAEYSDLQRLDVYLEQHYMEKISLTTISEALNISRTKLCAMAKRLSGGKTLSRMIAERRVAAAKVQLLRSNTPIAEVAEAVGIADYNYFTKIFRSITGETPSAFRSRNRRNVENFQV